MCKRIVLEGLCGYGEKCAYSHKIRSNLLSLENENVHEDVEILKAEVTSLKKATKSLTSIREEGEELNRYVKDIKEEIQFLDASNRKLVPRIVRLEEDLTDEPAKESDTSNENTLTMQVLIVKRKFKN